MELVQWREITANFLILKKIIQAHNTRKKTVLRREEERMIVLHNIWSSEYSTKLKGNKHNSDKKK